MFGLIIVFSLDTMYGSLKFKYRLSFYLISHILQTMTVEETEIEDNTLESIRDSDEYEELFDAIRGDYNSAEEGNIRGYENQDESVDQTIVIAIKGTDCDFGSLAFGLEDGGVVKASGSLHFSEESEEQTEIRDYRYIHDDEEFYTPSEDNIIEREERDSVEVLHYYQDK